MAVGNFIRNGTESPLLYVFIAFAAVAIWSTVPLTLRLFTTLKRRSGLYFWSILFTSWGLCIRQIGYTTQFLAPNCPWWVSLILGQSGWVAMVTGFNLVLYSRLNLILENYKIRRAILCAILFNGFVWHTTMCTISSGIAYNRNSGPSGKVRLASWSRVLDPLEKVQIVILSGQEITISLLYIRAAYQYLKSRFAQPGKTRNAMRLLFLVQVIIISLDVTLIVIDCAGYLQLKLFTFSFIYSVKLELEFVVLNQLVEISTMGVPGISFSAALASQRVNEGHAAPEKGPDPSVTAAQCPSPGLSNQTTPGSYRSSPQGSLDFITRPEGCSTRAFGRCVRSHR